MIWYFVILAILVGIFFLVRHKKKKKKIYPFVLAETSNDEDDFMNLWMLDRWEKELETVHPDALARTLAYDHTLDMIKLGKVYHKKPNPAFEKLVELGGTHMDEIVGGNYTEIKGLFNAFVESPKHYKAMMNPDINACGISILKNQKGKYFVTVILFRI